MAEKLSDDEIKAKYGVNIERVRKRFAFHWWHWLIVGFLWIADALYFHSTGRPKHFLVFLTAFAAVASVVKIWKSLNNQE